MAQSPTAKIRLLLRGMLFNSVHITEGIPAEHWKFQGRLYEPSNTTPWGEEFFQEITDQLDTLGGRDGGIRRVDFIWSLNLNYPVPYQLITEMDDLLEQYRKTFREGFPLHQTNLFSGRVDQFEKKAMVEHAGWITFPINVYGFYRARNYQLA